jgi:hypothetical protein
MTTVASLPIPPARAQASSVTGLLAGILLALVSFAAGAETDDELPPAELGVEIESEDAAPDDSPAEPEPEPEPAPDRRAPCPELEGPETPRLDSFQQGVERSVCVTAWYFDRLFGTLPEDEIVETRNTHGRLRAGVNWDERDGFGQEFTLRAQVQMPVARQRPLAVFGRDTDEAFIEGGTGEFDSVAFTEEDEDTSWLLGLGFEPMRGTRSRLSLGAGVRLRTPPDPFVQASYWFQDRLSENLLFRARQTVFWENEDGFGTSTRLVLERGLGPTRMLRWNNYLRVSEATDGMRWNTSLTLFNALSARRAIALRGGGGWIRQELSEPREFVPEGAVVLEMAFGRRQRESVAEES